MAFVLTAHRGSPNKAPENTLPAFAAAIADGADQLELDLQVSADGHLVVFHDQTVDRITDGEGPLADHTLAELRALSVSGERIATFDEVLEAIDGFPLQVELKAPKAAGELAALIRTRPELHDQFHINTGEIGYLTEMHRLLPSARLAYSAEGASTELVDRAVQLHGVAVYLSLPDLTEEIVAYAHGQGLLITGWLANTAADIQRALTLGLDGVTTDHVDVVRPVIDRLKPSCQN
jgi:glycerophosphoryl diester phosphodiesterase